jgi:hypothetical protein
MRRLSTNSWRRGIPEMHRIPRSRRREDELGLSLGYAFWDESRKVFRMWWPETGLEPLRPNGICNLYILNNEESGESARMPGCAFNLLSNIASDSGRGANRFQGTQMTRYHRSSGASENGPNQKSLPLEAIVGQQQGRARKSNIDRLGRSRTSCSFARRE